MIQHMVIVKFKPETASSQIDAIFGDLKALSQKLPGILHFSGGPYSSSEGLNQGFTHGFLLTFADAAARDAYLVHPDHERVKQAIIANMENGIAFDYKA